jgi:release factor glutamine methyltransferase
MSVLRWTTGRFEERGLATPRLDAEILLAQALGLPRLQLYVQFDRPLTSDELTAIRGLVKRRQGGESVAYIIGRKEFFGLEFAVDARVLVPRPDTETLVDEAIARLRPPARAPEMEVASGAEPPAEDPLGEAQTPPAPAAITGKVAEIGTGSGAIIVTLGKRLPDLSLFAVDVSPDALDVARANAARHGVSVTFLHGDLDAPLRPFAPFELIVANLPYIPTGDLADLAPEVQAEPRLALDGGLDGLDLVRRLCAAAPSLLAPGGALALELGAGQAPAVAAFCREAGLVDVQMRRDLGAIERVVSAKKP